MMGLQPASGRQREAQQLIHQDELLCFDKDWAQEL